LRHTSARNSFPAGNPIANVLVIIAGTLAIAASIVLGFFAFVALSAIILVTAAIIGVRVWWFKRKLRHGAGATSGGTEPMKSESVIEGEYRVVRKDSDQT